MGPNGSTHPVCDADVRPGGEISIDMGVPDGSVYPMTGGYRELVQPQRLDFTSPALAKAANSLFEVLNPVTFAEQDGKTTQTLGARVVKWIDGAAPYLEGMEEGWTQSPECLANHLATAAR